MHYSQFFSTRIPLLAVLCLFIFTGCKKESPPIRVGMIIWPGYDFLYLAEKNGFCKEEGVNVQLFDFVSLSDSRRAFERGQIDVVAGTIVELLITRESSDRSPQAFFVTDFSNGADVILGKSPISTVSELKGKRVGVEPASLDLLTLNLALRQNQMNLDDVTLIPLAQNGMEYGFEMQEVDAICTYPPTSLKVLSKGDANILFNSTQIPGYIVDVLMADESFINNRSEDLAKLLRAFDKAILFTKEHPEEALPVIADHDQLTVEELEVAYSGMIVEPLENQMQYFSDHGQLVKAASIAIEVLKETGVVKRDINLSAIINQQPVVKALSILNENE
jgi:NitT/TauT family transport system substrate-binding protein